ncbi:MAG: FAD-dependent thymidylate synthase [Deltaproteobacteria bacterium]
MADNSSQIAKYVSNTEGDIYTVGNLPEEVVAVIFAYVSRSAKSFRENILSVVREEEFGIERAAAFHEKWVLNYGHASVAEHATVHIGIERVSRLFSSLLELSNEYLSFTEYSQRYQKPKKGDFYIPPELGDKPGLLAEYVDLNNRLYDIYSDLYARLVDFLKTYQPAPEGVDGKAHTRALEKIAFEDARYALPLATFTNLGMTANARAIEDALTKMLSSGYPEARARAEEIKREVKFSVPTLVKYANENPYIKRTQESLLQTARQAASSRQGRVLNAAECGVKLLDWTGRGSPDAERAAAEKMARAIFFEHSASGYGEMGTADSLATAQKAVENLGKYDNPVNALKLISYEAELTISEACWHQLLRHRQVNWIAQNPSPDSGIRVPPNIARAKGESLLWEAAELGERFYKKLVGENLPFAASYAVINAHQRRVLGSFSLWEFYHLVNLRMSEGAQWDIRDVVGALAEEITKRHPNLAAPALARVS